MDWATWLGLGLSGGAVLTGYLSWRATVKGNERAAVAAARDAAFQKRAEEYQELLEERHRETQLPRMNASVSPGTPRPNAFFYPLRVPEPPAWFIVAIEALSPGDLVALAEHRERPDAGLASRLKTRILIGGNMPVHLALSKAGFQSGVFPVRFDFERTDGDKWSQPFDLQLPAS